MSIPSFEIEFDKQGKVVDPGQVEAAISGVQAAGAKDLLVISHGWNNNIADARDLYARLLARLEAQQAAACPGRNLAAIKVFWPSKKFTDKELIPGGAAALDDGSLDAQALKVRLDELKKDPQQLGGVGEDPARTQTLDQAKGLVSALETDPEAQRRFVELLRSLVSPDDQHPDDASVEFFADDPGELLRSLAEPVEPPLLPDTGDVGGAAAMGGGDFGVGDLDGGAAGLGDFFKGIKAGANRLLNYFTYYEMKQRAGLVGKTGVAEVLRQVHGKLPDVKLHLVGHSFGGRLVTATADALGPAVPPSTLTLLQAAYSHNGLAARFDGVHDGFFRAVLAPQRKVSGPILITYTKNDLAVGIAYPLGSRITHDVASALGDKDDPYGGMGRNGAQHLAAGTELDTATRDLGPVGTKYPFASRVYNLNADEFIKGHSDITKDEVAFALLSGVAKT
ncbi:MAG TPA: hypothetical protein VF173_06680 [Thermoanaerobaculia bacterium]|nr:hypothetical protein [Thermoanaerobaculia bacterium]